MFTSARTRWIENLPAGRAANLVEPRLRGHPRCRTWPPDPHDGPIKPARSSPVIAATSAMRHTFSLIGIAGALAAFAQTPTLGLLQTDPLNSEGYVLFAPVGSTTTLADRQVRPRGAYLEQCLPAGPERVPAGGR
jgi:hypothetical protein